MNTTTEYGTTDIVECGTCECGLPLYRIDHSGDDPEVYCAICDDLSLAAWRKVHKRKQIRAVAYREYAVSRSASSHDESEIIAKRRNIQIRRDLELEFANLSGKVHLRLTRHDANNLAMLGLTIFADERDDSRYIRVPTTWIPFVNPNGSQPYGLLKHNAKASVSVDIADRMLDALKLARIALLRQSAKLSESSGLRDRLAANIRSLQRIERAIIAGANHSGFCRDCNDLDEYVSDVGTIANGILEHHYADAEQGVDADTAEQFAHRVECWNTVPQSIRTLHLLDAMRESQRVDVDAFAPMLAYILNNDDVAGDRYAFMRSASASGKPHTVHVSRRERRRDPATAYWAPRVRDVAIRSQHRVNLREIDTTDFTDTDTDAIESARSELESVKVRYIEPEPYSLEIESELRDRRARFDDAVRATRKARRIFRRNAFIEADRNMQDRIADTERERERERKIKLNTANIRAALALTRT